MIELPESVNLAKQAKKFLTGKKIAEVQVLKTPHKFAFFREHPEDFPEMLTGQTFQDAAYHGGFLEFLTEDRQLLFSDGASFHYCEKQEDFPKSHQFALFFEDGTALFMSVRMYAILLVCEKGQCQDGYFISSSTKWNPLDKEFTYDYFRSLVPAGKKLSAKAFLATEQRIPGLGNGVLQDILWDAGFDPRFPVQDMSEDDFKTLYSSVCHVLKKMCDDGGRDTENDLFGNKCGYISQLSKNTLLEPCMKCGGPLEKTAYMGGTVYFCAHCQRRQ